MRWYINRNGETGGPYDEDQVVAWFKSRAIGLETQVQRETGGEWMPLLKTPFSKRLGSQSNPRFVVGGMVFVACAAAFMYAGDRNPTPQAPPEPKPITATTLADQGTKEAPPKQPTEYRCAVHMPGSTGLVPVFPTEEGHDEFGKAAISGDEQAIAVALVANDGFMVAPKTKCTWLDRGFLVTKVRIIEGPHTGKVGYVPSEWGRIDAHELSGPCPGETVVPSADLWACSETCTSPATVELRNASGELVASVDSPVRVQRLESAESGSDSIKRSAGHVDAKVCVLDSDRAGTVAYVQNTTICAHDCAAEPTPVAKPAKTDPAKLRELLSRLSELERAGRDMTLLRKKGSSLDQLRKCGQLMRTHQPETDRLFEQASMQDMPFRLHLGVAATELKHCVSCLETANEYCVRAAKAIKDGQAELAALKR